jgi:hypothetical protein
MISFFLELERRNVYKVAVAYAIRCGTRFGLIRVSKRIVEGPEPKTIYN